MPFVSGDLSSFSGVLSHNKGHKIMEAPNDSKIQSLFTELFAHLVVHENPQFVAK